MTPLVTVRSFPLLLSEQEARSIAQNKGGIFGRLFLMGKVLHEIRLHMVEYKILTFEILYRPGLLSRLFGGEGKTGRQFCRIIANGSTGGCSWAEDIPAEREERTLQEDRVQPTSFSMEQLAMRGRKLALRVLHRRVGGFPEVRLKEVDSVYRPFYVALYDKPVEGTRIRYLPIAADGCSNQRTN